METRGPQVDRAPAFAPPPLFYPEANSNEGSASRDALPVNPGLS